MSTNVDVEAREQEQDRIAGRDLGTIGAPMSEDQEEKEYFLRIDECAATGSDLIISNSLPKHASYLMQKLFLIGKKHIRLFSGELIRSATDAGVCKGPKPELGVKTTNVYSDDALLAAMSSFLHQDGRPKLEVLVQHGVDGGMDDHPMFLLLHKMKEDGSLRADVEIRRIDDSYKDFDRHFMVADEKAYRLELGHEPCRAIASFGDAVSARSLIEAFDKKLFRSGGETLLRLSPTEAALA